MHPIPAHPPRVNVYVDGFNLYYGSLKATPYKWLDLAALCSVLFPGEPIGRIRYFTAHVDPTPGNLSAPIRQQTYLRALHTIPNLTVRLGHFLTEMEERIEVYPLNPGAPKVPNHANRLRWVWDTEEKGSDVNLATSLLLDAVDKDFTKAWVLTNDSDLAWPIEMARMKFRLPVGVMMPDRPAGYPNPPRTESMQLKKAARWFRRIEEAHLIASQFPASLADPSGTITKPTGW